MKMLMTHIYHTSQLGQKEYNEPQITHKQERNTQNIPPAERALETALEQEVRQTKQRSREGAEAPGWWDIQGESSILSRAILRTCLRPGQSSKYEGTEMAATGRCHFWGRGSNVEGALLEDLMKKVRKYKSRS